MRALIAAVLWLGSANLGAPAGITSRPSQAQTAPADEHEVEMALTHYAHLVETMDHAGIARLYAENGEIVNPGQPPIHGRAAIEVFLRQFADYKVQHHEVHATKTVVDGDHARQEGTYQQRVRVPDGQVVEVSGQFTAEWIREDGQWHILRMGTTPAK
jgi:uncharacterized protein (TIGR02246 family)